MTYAAIAQDIANNSVVFWFIFFLCIYAIFSFWYKKEFIKALGLSGAAVIYFFTFLNILSVRFVPFGGVDDNLLAFQEGGLIYIVHIVFLYVTALLTLRFRSFYLIGISVYVSTTILLTLFYFEIFYVLGFVWTIFAGYMFYYVYYARKVFKENLFNKLSRKPKLIKTIYITLFLWSLVWVGGFLYRNREVVFDCSLDSYKAELLGQYDGFTADFEPISKDQFFNKVGTTNSSVDNYFDIRYSEKDTTYFYCPHRRNGNSDSSCRGYRVTIGSDNLLKNMQKRGLSCSTRVIPLQINPMSDPVYYFYWSADMWLLDFMPSENYDMDRDHFLFTLLSKSMGK